MNDALTLPELLRRTAERHPARGVGIFDGRGRELGRRTYPQILAAAQGVAARLSGAGVVGGDRVLICLQTSWELIDAWLGSLLAGAWPVALAPAPLGAAESHTEKVAQLALQLDSTLVLGGRVLAEHFESARGDDLPRRVWPFARLLAVDPAPWPSGACPTPDDVAFLQLTSGSTGRSRAVMISHAAAIHNNRASDLAIGAPFARPAGAWAESLVSWLPLNHDMGLVGCLWMSISLGLDLWLLNPAAFLSRPVLWLQQLAAHGATFAPAPNFGYQLCVERVDPAELDGLDLSGWRAAMTGAEMIRPETFAAFDRLVARSGLRPEAIRPCYGLAEGTLAVTFDRRGEGLRTLPRPDDGADEPGASAVVSVGPPIDDTQVEITAPDGRPFPEGRVGEVRVKGPGVFLGYFNDEAATAETLERGWLRTGDLGFMSGGELYLTGRIKDVLIIRGTNIMPHELEWLAESVAGGGGSLRCGAFSVTRGSEGEQAVLVVETAEKGTETLAEMEREIRRRIGSALSLPVADLVFVRRGQIAKTTSGKVKRVELRRQYLAGRLERLT